MIMLPSYRIITGVSRAACPLFHRRSSHRIFLIAVCFEWLDYTTPFSHHAKGTECPVSRLTDS
ncbi:hypothetical protein CY34DRAFT_544013 [Suillus luteus UH-Slu-Lm8-n1]|uniref:Uncharacterized protein n=1 Tax=Suillus luteus UH-Slu-Lm8-n1 TaxID=930992 RepID=A0A0D0AP03_9AGAM|nr:hypothetical protein CY34DRAFT_544013 [Suillus luteus UH-Slu-Lm8-n1]